MQINTASKNTQAAEALIAILNAHGPEMILTLLSDACDATGDLGVLGASRKLHEAADLLRQAAPLIVAAEAVKDGNKISDGLSVMVDFDDDEDEDEPATERTPKVGERTDGIATF